MNASPPSTPPRESAKAPILPTLPAVPMDRVSRPLRQFLHTESASGVVLIAATVIALAVANSPWGAPFRSFWQTTVTVGGGSLQLSYPLWYWINDGLMTLFFFVIGLEIKRELVHGELSDRRKLLLPAVAALGGAAVPALVFVVALGGAAGMRAWAVPMATDIAFVVGILALLGRNVPVGLKVFLLSLAIVDDIIAVLVIAAFYSGSLQSAWLLAAVAGFGVVFALQRAGARSLGVYGLVGLIIWLCTLKSGIHPTVAGVFLGLLTPTRAWLAPTQLSRIAAEAPRMLAGASAAQARQYADRMLVVSRESVSPLARLESMLHPWVAFGIMPVFALANAGVALQVDALGSPVALAIALALVFGKTVGISAATWSASRFFGARLPQGVTWPMVLGGALLSGIGFTMSLFIASLALEGPMLEAAKTGILVGSLVAGVAGYLVLRRLIRQPSSQT